VDSRWRKFDLALTKELLDDRAKRDGRESPCVNVDIFAGATLAEQLFLAHLCVSVSAGLPVDAEPMQQIDVVSPADRLFTDGLFSMERPASRCANFLDAALRMEVIEAKALVRNNEKILSTRPEYAGDLSKVSDEVGLVLNAVRAEYCGKGIGNDGKIPCW
jgi:hypothetical protein